MPNPMIRRVNWSITTSTRCVRRLSDSQRNRSMLHKLFECIRTEMRKGSPEGYNAENGYSQPARKPQTGEPYERQPLYRIRCTQEKYQLLREDCRRDHRGRRHAASDAPGATGVGTEAAGAVARRDGSHAVQRMDLRYVETLRCRVANGTSDDDEGDRRIQEEERQTGRAENRGPGALQSVASMLCGAEGNPRTAADAALPQPGGGAGDAHEEQDERAAHGGGSRVQHIASAREHELLDSIEEVPESVKDLLRLSRGALEMFQTT